MLKNSFKILIIFILIFNTFVSSAMAANQPYDHNELLQYKGYGEAMYDTVVEQTTFITGQYTENKEFVSKTIDQIKDYANFWKQEAVDMWNEDTLRGAIERGGGYLLTVGDFVKNLFNDYGDKYYPSENDDLGVYNAFVDVDPKCSTEPLFCDHYKVKDGYAMIIQSANNSRRYTQADGFNNFHFSDTWISTESRNYYLIFVGAKFDGKLLPNTQALIDFFYAKTKGDFGVVMSRVNKIDISIKFELIGGGDVKPPTKPSAFGNMRKYINDNIKDVATPQPRPYLSCPNGTKIQMSISGSTFLSVDGQVMIVNKDGAAEVDSAICKLGWDKPVVKYIDDRAAIETPDGKWQDAETGKMLDGDGNGGYQCVENGVVVPCKDIEKPDGSLLAYVKNAYEYATGYLETAVNGLKSLGSGAVGVTALYKIFFGWLPQEIVVLMTSGLAIMLGLRIFRK